jgi:hypothetical protein
MMSSKKRINSHAEHPAYHAPRPVPSTIGDGHLSEDADRLHAAHEALAGFRLAVEQSQPNSRVRTLGLA